MNVYFSVDYILLLVSWSLLCIALLALRRVDRLPLDCQPEAAKEIGLIALWSACYFLLTLRWIDMGLGKKIPTADDFAWKISELCSMIIFLRMIGREINCFAKPIGQMLINEGVVTEDKLCHMLAEQKKTQKRFRLL